MFLRGARRVVAVEPYAFISELLKDLKLDDVIGRVTLINVNATIEGFRLQSETVDQVFVALTKDSGLLLII